MDSLNRGWISHLRKSEAHFNLPAISVCVCAAGALLNFTLLLYLWCNIPGCECSVRGKKRTCCFLVIFSFFPQQVGNKPTSSLSIFSSYKMKTEIVHPPPPFLAHLLLTNFAACNLYNTSLPEPWESKRTIFATQFCFYIVVSGFAPSNLPGLHVGSISAFLMALDPKLTRGIPIFHLSVVMVGRPR